MNITYKDHRIIEADIKDVAEFFSQIDTSHNYFPEIQKDTKNMTTYICNSHKHPERVFPDYQIPGFGLGWSNGGGTSIRLPRRDVHANIQRIDVEYTVVDHNTKITLYVEFNPNFSLEGLIAVNHVRMMVNNKLRAFKNDLETFQHQDWERAFI